MTRIVIVANNAGDFFRPGVYLKAFDPEAFDGQGDAVFTLDKSEAMEFADMKDAAVFYLTIPKARPWRPDGRPNRPLTAFTITFE